MSSSLPSYETKQTFHNFMGTAYAFTPEPGREFLRVFTKGDKVSVYEYAIERSIKPHKLVNRCRAVQVYEKHTSKTGKPYLTVHARIRDGKMKDISVEKLLDDEIFSQLETRVDAFSYEAYMKEVLCDWFGLNKSEVSDTFTEVTDEMLFPLFKNAEEPLKSGDFCRALASLESTTGIVARALRDSANWDDFFWSITCEGTVSSQLDLDILSRNIISLLPAATMNLGMSLNEMLMPNSGLYSVSALSALNAVEKDCVRFMLQHIQESERLSAATIVVTMAKLLRESRKRGSSFSTVPGYGTRAIRGIETYTSAFPKIKDGVLPFNRVPDDLRPELAQKLLDQIVKVTEALQDEKVQGANSLMSGMVRGEETQLEKTFATWFSEYVVEPSLLSKTTEADLEERFAELFNASASTCSGGLNFGEYGLDKTVFCLSSMEHDAVDLFKTLASFVKRPPFNRGDSFTNTHINAVSATSLLGPASALHSLDDVLEVVEGSAARIDVLLRKMGREVTPDNRRACLIFGTKECRLPSTWRYYDCGVNDLQTLITLKMSNIVEEEDVRAFVSLPEEMFHELIEMHAATPDAGFVLKMSPAKFARRLRGIRDLRTLSNHTTSIPTEIRSKLKHIAPSK